MKPLLVIGLGNPLMGDEGVGWHVAERLSGDPRLPADAEVVCGGTDLLRYADSMEQRRRVIVVDALHDDAEPGSVSAWEETGGAGASACQPFPQLDNGQDNVHCLSAVQAIQLLRMTVPIPITLLGISIPCANVQSGLSPELAARMPMILERVLHELA
jgi:hydrogenase maturation protease